MPPEDGHPRGLVNRREGANGWRHGTNGARSQDPGERGGPGDGPEEMPDDQRALDVGGGGQSHCPHPPHARGVRATESARCGSTFDGPHTAELPPDRRVPHTPLVLTPHSPGPPQKPSLSSTRSVPSPTPGLLGGLLGSLQETGSTSCDLAAGPPSPMPRRPRAPARAAAARRVRHRARPGRAAAGHSHPHDPLPAVRTLVRTVHPGVTGLVHHVNESAHFANRSAGPTRQKPSAALSGENTGAEFRGAARTGAQEASQQATREAGQAPPTFQKHHLPLLGHPPQETRRSPRCRPHPGERPAAAAAPTGHTRPDTP